MECDVVDGSLGLGEQLLRLVDAAILQQGLERCAGPLLKKVGEIVARDFEFCSNVSQLERFAVPAFDNLIRPLWGFGTGGSSLTDAAG